MKKFSGAAFWLCMLLIFSHQVHAQPLKVYSTLIQDTDQKWLIEGTYDANFKRIESLDGRKREVVLTLFQLRKRLVEEGVQKPSAIIWQFMSEKLMAPTQSYLPTHGDAWLDSVSRQIYHLWVDQNHFYVMITDFDKTLEEPKRETELHPLPANDPKALEFKKRNLGGPLDAFTQKITQAKINKHDDIVQVTLTFEDKSNVIWIIEMAERVWKQKQEPKAPK